MKKAAIYLATAFFSWFMAVIGLSAQDESTVKGLITGRTADTLVLRSSDGAQEITLTDSTKVQTPKGLGLPKQQMSWTI